MAGLMAFLTWTTQPSTSWRLAGHRALRHKQAAVTDTISTAVRIVAVLPNVE